MTRDGVLVVSHDRRLNPDHTRGPDGKFLDAEGPPIRTLTLRRAAALRRRPAQAGQRLCGGLSGAAAGRRRAHSDARGAVRSGARAGADHVRFNIETKITPTSGAETPDPEAFAAAVAAAIRAAGLAARTSVQSFDWRTLMALQTHRPGDRARLPHRRGAQFRHDQARRARPLALDRRARYRRLRRLGAAPGRGRGLRRVVAALPQRQAGRCRGRQGARPQGDPLDGERARRHGAADRARRRRR